MGRPLAASTWRHLKPIPGFLAARSWICWSVTMGLAPLRRSLRALFEGQAALPRSCCSPSAGGARIPSRASERQAALAPPTRAWRLGGHPVAQPGGAHRQRARSAHLQPNQPPTNPPCSRSLPRGAGVSNTFCKARAIPSMINPPQLAACPGPPCGTRGGSGRRSPPESKQGVRALKLE